MREAINKGKKCSENNCDYAAFCKGLCKAHYEQMRQHGHITGPVIPHKKNRGGITVDNPVEYRAWNLMKRRCFNNNTADYSKYGGRGICVCDRWKNSFSNFLKDMGKRPEGCSLDRIDVNGDYCPENCRWATWNQQQRNRRNNREEPCIYPWEGKYYVQVQRNGVHKRKLCDTMEDAIKIRDIFEKDLEVSWL